MENRFERAFGPIESAYNKTIQVRTGPYMGDFENISKGSKGKTDGPMLMGELSKTQVDDQFVRAAEKKDRGLSYGYRSTLPPAPTKTRKEMEKEVMDQRLERRINNLSSASDHWGAARAPRSDSKR